MRAGIFGNKKAALPGDINPLVSLAGDERTLRVNHNFGPVASLDRIVRERAAGAQVRPRLTAVGRFMDVAVAPRNPDAHAAAFANVDDVGVRRVNRDRTVAARRTAQLHLPRLSTVFALGDAVL